MPAREGHPVVADASAIAAIAFGEPSGARAVELLAEEVLHEPTLLAYELASVARRKAADAPGRAEAILQALALALTLDIRWVEVDHPAVVRLALEDRVSTYDASYLCVAIALGAPLVTLDETLVRAARTRGVICWGWVSGDEP